MSCMLCKSIASQLNGGVLLSVYGNPEESARSQRVAHDRERGAHAGLRL